MILNIDLEGNEFFALAKTMEQSIDDHSDNLYLLFQRKSGPILEEKKALIFEKLCQHSSEIKHENMKYESIYLIDFGCDSTAIHSDMVLLSEILQRIVSDFGEDLKADVILMDIAANGKIGNDNQYSTDEITVRSLFDDSVRNETANYYENMLMSIPNIDAEETGLGIALSEEKTAELALILQKQLVDSLASMEIENVIH